MDMSDEHLVLFLDKKGFPMLCSIDLPVNVDSKVLKFLISHSC